MVVGPQGVGKSTVLQQLAMSDSGLAGRCSAWKSGMIAGSSGCSTSRRTGRSRSPDLGRG
jgi:ABC-type lipoprotein export system ATPase subunit